MAMSEEEDPTKLRPEGVSRNETIIAQIDKYEAEEKVGYKTMLRNHARRRLQRPMGRPRTPRGLARVRVAAELDLTLRRVAEIDRKRAERPTLERRIHTYGIEIREDYEDNLKEMAIVALSISRKIDWNVRLIHGLRVGPLPTGYDKLKDIGDELKAVAQKLRDWGPRALCPYCKGQSRGQAACKECDGLGWEGKREKYKQVVPRRLLKEGGPPMYMHQGKLVPAKEGWNECGSDGDE